MYCGSALRTSDGVEHRMANVLPVSTAMEAGTLRSGYRDLRIATSGMLGVEGTRLRGHEFHFSRVLSSGESWAPLYSVHDCDGEPLGFEGWTRGAFAASFVNLHFGQQPKLAAHIVAAARSAGGVRNESARETAELSTG
jgi:cobyrinic acid a,c-diamide synthase